MLRLIAAAFLLFSGPALAEEASFNRLTCKSVISSDLTVTSPGDSLELAFEARGDELRPLVRKILPASIPDSLVRAYHCIKLTATLPQAACTFSADAPESFACAAGPVALAVSARLSCYEDEADFYQVDAASFQLSSELFAGTRDRGYFRLKGEVELDAGSVPFETEEYLAHDWDYDGFPQDPECSVDGAPIRF